jgi:DNA primase
MDFVEQLKSSIDIVKVIGEYVRLRRVGSTGRYTGLCPFHQEKTASFNVNQARQFYKCFGCGVGGDVLKFVMEIEGLTFPETLKLLAERNGIQMPKRTEYADAESKLRGVLFDIHVIASNLFQASLRAPQGAEARAYLDRRGVSQELIDTFELGFSEPSGQALVRRLAQERFTPEQLEASGVVRKREDGSGYFDAFRGRLMFPIHNESGKVIAFGGRAMRDGDQPKYLNSPETPIYKKTSVLYNLHRARDGMRRSNRAVLVEGYMDVIGVYAAGVKEVVASCGTALTNAQVRTIHRHADTVIVNFDPDSAGANAAERAIPLFLEEGMHVRVLALDGGLDPDEYVKQNGAEGYRNKLDSAGGYFHWLADRARAKFDMRSADGRMDAFRFLQPAIEKITDQLERAAIANDVAGYLGVEPGLVLERFRKSASERRAPAPRAEPRPQIPAVERILLNALISSDEARVEILPRLADVLTAEFTTREIFATLRNLVDAGPQSLSSAALFSAVESRLVGPSQTLLHEIVAADEMGDGSFSLEQARACLRRLELDFKKRQMDELRTSVKTAEREGRVQEAFGFMAELSRLERELRGAGGG